jgi:hypothetical protein
MTEKLKIVIEVDSATGETRVRQLGERLEGTGRKGGQAFKETNRSLDTMKSRLSSAHAGLMKIAGAVAGVLAVRAAFRRVNAAMRENIALANEQDAVEARRNAVLEATNHAAGYNAEQLDRMAAAMQRVTTVGDETIIKGQAVLLTFKQIRGEGFERAMAAALDMAEVMQQDLNSALMQIGKALHDPLSNLSALSRAGVQFTDDQKSMIQALAESNRMMEAQDIILRELESQFGGAAAVAASTFGGAVKQAQNTLGDLKEELGFVITRNEFFIALMHELTDAFGEWSEHVAESRDQVMSLTKDGVLYLGDALIFGVRTLQFFHQGWQGIQIVGHGAVHALSVALEELYNNLRMFMAPLDLIYMGLRELGVIDINPFDSWQRNLEMFGESSRDVVGQVVDDIARTDRRYGQVTSTLQELRARLAGVGVTAVDAGQAGLTAGEAIEDGMENAEAATDALRESMDDLAQTAVGIYRELYEHTGIEEYAQSAIAAYGKVLDAQESTWRKILGNEDDVQRLRAKREQEFVDTAYGALDQVVAADEAAANDRIRIAERLADRRVQLERGTAAAVASAAGGGVSSGLPVGPESRFVMVTYKGATYGPFSSRAAADAYLDQIERQTEAMTDISAGTSRLVDYARSAEQRDLEQVQREREQAWQTWVRDQERMYESLMGTVRGLADFIGALGAGPAAPVQSRDALVAEYQRRYGAAYAGEEGAVSALTSYVSDFLSFVQAFGGYEDYFGAVMEDLERLHERYETMGWTSAVVGGVDTTELALLVDAFVSAGVPLEDLKQAAISAATSVGVLKDQTVLLDTHAGLGAEGFWKLAVNTSRARYDAELLAQGLYTLDDGTKVAVSNVAGLAQGLYTLDDGTKVAVSSVAGLAAASQDTAEGGVRVLGNELMYTEAPFQNVVDALGTMTGTTKEKLVAAAQMWEELAAGIGQGMPSIAGGISAAYVAAQASPTITYQPTVIDVPWTRQKDDVGTWGWYNPEAVWGAMWSYSSASPPPVQKVVYGQNFKGGLATQPGTVAEIGPEWVVPTYEPYKSQFLRDVGADPELIGDAIARRIGPALANSGGGGDVHVYLNVDGDVLATAIARQFRQGHPELVEQARRRVN